MRMHGPWRLAFVFLLVTSYALAAGINYSGGNGLLVFGVTNYGGGAQINPAYIPNNFSGINDILSTPGGGFQLANPVVGNNISQFGPGALPGAGFQVGGGNPHG